MLVHIPDHFSSSFKFNFTKKNCIAVDRSSLLKTLLILFSGVGLFALGAFEMFTFITSERDNQTSYLVVEIFAFMVILLASGIIVNSILSLVRYKKFYFDGNNFTIVYRPSFNIKYELKENISEYMGVRLRVLFTQCGILNKNRYIIDLYHQDNNKIVPLYISTNKKNIRKIWLDYAKMFKLPTLSISERGLTMRNYENLDKSLTELAKTGDLPFIASGKFPAPETLTVIENTKTTTLYPNKLHWDTLNILILSVILSAIAILAIGGVYLSTTGSNLTIKYWLLLGFTVMCMLYFLQHLFSRTHLNVGDKYIAIKDISLGKTTNEMTVNFDKIKNVELTYNPTTGRYGIAIITHNDIISINNKLPASDLLWLKDYIVRKLVGNF